MKKASLTESPQTVHARVSVAVMWKRLEELEAVAHNTAKVKEWARNLRAGLGRSKAC